MEKEKAWIEHVQQHVKTINPTKVAKLILALNETLLKIGFPFTPLELQVAFNELISAHLLRASQEEPSFGG